MLLLPPIQSANYKFLGYWQWRATLSFFPSPGSAAADLGYLVSVLLRRDTVGAIACVVRLSRYLWIISTFPPLTHLWSLSMDWGVSLAALPAMLGRICSMLALWCCSYGVWAICSWAGRRILGVLVFFLRSCCFLAFRVLNTHSSEVSIITVTMKYP